ncbi:FecR family protein [Pedobacter sp. MC2016-24]|uniref:FecR family protein n=1 Tax=Pedobacter sp. MC2016-24 TaxID=2780090 RepID=UPI00188194C0|nr:FecR family protein [Pedobacter sp. MC2016-24]MBE9601808.1 FecR family protein [Pedobacter sp. MC2016-24]
MKDKINHLLLRFEEGDMSKIETEELLELIDQAEAQVGLAIAEGLDQQIPTDHLKAGEWANVLEKIISVDRVVPKKKLFSPYLRWVAAAAVFLTVGLGYHYLQLVHPENTQPIPYANDIKPGKNDAVLTLADGSKISLTDARQGELIKSKGISIVKAANGQLIYTIDSSALKTGTDHPELAYNTISTPKGGEYQINLPDGTKVWLNAASSLKFPQTFANLNARRVELSGEAYFEVFKNKKQPFKVLTPGFGSGREQETEVLGTHFNISAYADDAETKTTLLEGSIRVKDPQKSNKRDAIILVPGQQAILNNNQWNTINVDTEEAIAWKRGTFMFANADIETIMRKISRWYNVEVVYQGKISESNYLGTVSRFSKVSDVLDILEATKTVHFKIEGRRITVMP